MRRVVPGRVNIEELGNRGKDDEGRRSSTTERCCGTCHGRRGVFEAFRRIDARRVECGVGPVDSRVQGPDTVVIDERAHS